jgi:hypothetical protein
MIFIILGTHHMRRFAMTQVGPNTLLHVQDGQSQTPGTGNEATAMRRSCVGDAKEGSHQTKRIGGGQRSDERTPQIVK